MVQCPGCENYHLVADRLGFFEERGGWDVERLLAERGERVTRIDDDNLAAHLMTDEERS